MPVDSPLTHRWLNLAKRLNQEQTAHAELVVKDFFVPEQGISRHEINHDISTKLWCGPAALSCLTGASTSQVRALIRQFRKDHKARVQGTWDDEVQYVFRKLGYQMDLRYMCCSTDPKGRPTLARWLRESTRAPTVGYLVGLVDSSGGHWAVVHGGYYCCGITGKWVPLNEAPTRRRRVDIVFTITKAL